MQAEVISKGAAMFGFKKFFLTVVLGAMLAVQAPAISQASTVPELRFSVITLISTRIDQLQVERDAALAAYRDTSLSFAERLAAGAEYRAVCARQYKLRAQARRISRLPRRALLALETFLTDLVSPT